MLTRATLFSWRNYTHVSVPIAEGTTLLVGANAQGKTNVLEALRYASVFRSFRQATTKDLVRWGDEVFRILIEADGQELEVAAQTGRKKIRMGGIPVEQESALGFLPTVVFLPEDVDLLPSDSATKRSFLNALLLQTSPTYAQTHKQFLHVLAQRTKMLQMGGNRDELAVWTSSFLVLAEQLVRERFGIVAWLQKEITTMYRQVSGGQEEIALRYLVSGVNEVVFLEDVGAVLRGLADRVAERERVRQRTLFGPQRDTIHFFINNKNAGKTASRGERRTLLFALKVLEARYIAEKIHRFPVLLFDDIFSELDTARSATILQLLERHQVVLTATDAQRLPTLTGAKNKQYRVHDATLLPLS